LNFHFPSFALNAIPTISAFAASKMASPLTIAAVAHASASAAFGAHAAAADMFPETGRIVFGSSTWQNFTPPIISNRRPIPEVATAPRRRLSNGPESPEFASSIEIIQFG
jgi:hypothetical protein